MGEGEILRRKLERARLAKTACYSGIVLARGQYIQSNLLWCLCWRITEISNGLECVHTLFTWWQYTLGSWNCNKLKLLQNTLIKRSLMLWNAWAASALSSELPSTGSHNTALDALVTHLVVLFPGPFEATHQSATVRTWFGVDQKHKQEDQGTIPVDCWLFTFLSFASNVFIFCTFYWRVQHRYMAM